MDYSFAKKATIDLLIQQKVAKAMQADPQLDDIEATAQVLNADRQLYDAYCRTSSVRGTADD
jgi:hypothetical protein